MTEENLPQMSEAEDLRPEITVGSLLGRSLSTLMKNFPQLFVIALIFNIPDAIVEFAIVPTLRGMTANFVSQVSTFLFGGLVTGAVLYGVVQSLGGGKVDIGKCLSIAIARIVPIFLISLLWGLGVGIGFILLVVPGAILACMWYVAVPATVVEKTGVAASFNRSAELTKGHRMTLFLTALVFMGITFAVSLLVVAPMIIAGAGLAAITIVSLVLGLTVGLWSNVTMGVAYHDLRVAKDGVNTEQLASVFD